MEQKPTIFITISVGMIARNLLDNTFWKLLQEKYRVVILTSLKDTEAFKELYCSEETIIEPLVIHKLSRLEKFFWSLHKGLIYNPTTKLRAFYGLTIHESRDFGILKSIKNNLEYVVFGLILSRISPLRDLVKYIDRKLFTKDYYAAYIQKYKPVAIFTTNAASDDETYVIRSAKKHNIPTIGMTKSWDNFSKIGFREKVDHMIVWSDFMKDEVLQFQNYKESEISVVGIPQFDIYESIERTHTKEDFKKTYGLDVNKKTILVGDGGLPLSIDDPYIVGVIKDWIIKNKKPYQILIRPHTMYGQAAIQSFAGLADGKTVIMDDKYTPSSFGRGGGFDFHPDHHTRLALSMHFADVVVTSISTLVLDAMANKTPVICYFFDKDKERPYRFSIKRLYDTLWFIELRKYGLDKTLVMNEEELCEKIESVLTEGVTLEYAEAREKIVERLCYKIDGKSGERLFEALEGHITNN